jgi:hypothetical protein
MTPKLLIINNGLKDLCGHYFETSISVAEAARDLGYRPILAAHTTCQPGIIPSWIEFHPLFCTDHWMLDPPVLPPEPVKPGRRLLNLARRLKRWLRAHVPPLLAPPCRRLYRLVRPARSATDSAAAPNSEREHDPLVISLRAIGLEKEFDYMLLFQRDLQRLLDLTKAGAGDHVFLPTAHGRELVAVQRILREKGSTNAPMFHLEFRHELDMTGWFEDPAFVHPYTKVHGVLFEHSRRSGPSPRVRLYIDTQELAEEYEQVSGLKFDLLPIPFRTNLIRPEGRPSDKGVCIAYFGDVRDEKGFYHLPAIVDDLRAAYVEAGKVRFLIQSSLNHPEWNPKSAAALERLQAYPPHQVRLVGDRAPLSPDEYFRLVSEADLLLCPYSPIGYKRRSSGTLTEGIAAGIPTVVPADTWLGRQQPPGTGEQFRDEASLLAAVRRICDDYARYWRQAQEAKNEWLAVHTPAALVKTLIANSPEPRTKVA